MAVSASDPAYRAEVTPPAIGALGVRLCSAWGVGATAFGSRGNLQHTNGYHRSRRYNLVHAPGNYSIQLAADRGGDENWVSAFDFTPDVWGTAANRSKMTIITKRMRAAARARDPRIRTLREFAGTEDGHNVVTIDMQTGGDRTPFDSSHLDHGHGSILRMYAADDHTGIFEVMAGIPAGGESEMDVNDPIPGVPGLTLGVLLRDLWTNAVVQRGLTLDASGVPQRHPADRWTQPHLLTAQVTAQNALIALVNSGGGDLEVGTIVQAVKDATEATHGYMLQLQEDLEQSAAREAELRRQLAAAFTDTPPQQ